MTRPTFPETPVADDDAYLAELERRRLRAAHWQRGWLRRFVRDEAGAIVRIAFAECPADCPCHDDGWWR